MGLRPTVKSEGSISDSTVPMSHRHNNKDKGSSHEGDGKSPGSSIEKSFAASKSTPQREAWTARGQLLLNFHHAISRAINSPEMVRKCSQIAEDMTRSEEGNAASQSSLGSSVDPSHGQTRTNDGSILGRPKSHPSMAEEYGAEAALIVENKSKRDAAVRNKAVALGLFSFVTLRSGRGLSSWVRKSIAKRRIGSSYQFEMSATHQLHSNSAASLVKNTNAATSVELKQPTKLRRFLRLAVDVTISTSITFLSGAFLFMPRPSAYIEDMSKLPLVAGKSVYAEMVCPPLLKEYQRVLEQYGGRWPVRGAPSAPNGSAQTDAATTPQLTQEDVSLNIIRAFVENCSKRSKYERALLEERNALNFDKNQSTAFTVSRLMRRMTKSNEDISTSSIDGDNLKSNEDVNKLGTVSVPSPGVPETITVNIDQDLLPLAIDENDDDEKCCEEKNKK